MLLVVALISIYQGISFHRVEQESEALARAQAETASQQKAVSAGIYKDGTFSGSAQGYGGTITMEVTIKDDVITDIKAVSHSGEDAAYWDMAKDMIPQIIQTQNPNVDTVSGATFSSTGIHNAVTIALQNALRQ